jgi:uncharacterized repeat protein (TIGR03803 family)
MQMKPSVRFVLLAGGVLAIGLAATRAQGGVKLSTLATFNGTNGANPSAALVEGKDGSFYGTTYQGGTNGYGTIFRVTLAGMLTNLFCFSGTNGANPLAGLVEGNDGLFYGTTFYGGTSSNGTVFKVDTNGLLTSQASFNGANGAWPHATLAQGSDGNFYGTTAIGGANSAGTAFQVTTNGTLTNLVSFDYRGYSPYAGLVQGSGGNFYGTTFQGGSNGYGTVFRLSTSGSLTNLVSFNGTNGANPYAGLEPGQDGGFYGTTYYGGASGYGTVFRVTTDGTLTTLTWFNGTNGAYPQARLVQAADGNFYGTTAAGGAYTNQFGSGYGTVFKVTTNGDLTTLVCFNGTNGASPQAGLVQGADGSFYGTTANGGASDSGTVFQLSISSPPPPVFEAVAQSGGTLTLTWSATPGETYQLQFTTNVGQPAWASFGDPILATNAVMVSVDMIGPDATRFYRAALLP